MQTNTSLLWTLEEISHLVSGSGNPSETLTNIVNLIQQRFATDVCSVYLLEPDRTTLVLAATIGLRQEGVGRVRMRITEGLAGLVAEQVRPSWWRTRRCTRASSISASRARTRTRHSSAYRSIDRGVLQGVLVVQTVEARSFGEDDMRMLATAGMQLAPIVSEARTVGVFVAPVHQKLAAIAQNLWWTWTEEAVSIFREIDPVLWRECDHNPIVLLQRTPISQLEARASQLTLHGRINYTYRRLQEYLQSKHTWGGQHASVLGARPVAYFSAEFGLHESTADLLRRPRHPRRRSSQERVRPRHSARGHRPLLRPGLLPAAPGRQRLAARGLHRRRQRRLPTQPAMLNGHPLVVEIATRTGPLLARVWRVNVGRNMLLLLDSNVDGNSPEDRQLTSRLYGGDSRVRIRQELLLGVGGARSSRRSASRPVSCI